MKIPKKSWFFKFDQLISYLISCMNHSAEKKLFLWKEGIKTVWFIKGGHKKISLKFRLCPRYIGGGRGLPPRPYLAQNKNGEY